MIPTSWLLLHRRRIYAGSVYGELNVKNRTRHHIRYIITIVQVP